MDDHNLPDTSMSVNDNCVNVKDFQTKISGAVTAAHENGDSGNEYIDLDFEFLNEEWGDDEDSDGNDTNDFTELKETKLVWKENNQFEKIKRGIYMKGKTSKSTYYDKYGPNGTFTKATTGVKKITNFFKVRSNT
ncbi:12008_t:CDS:1 [Funneliformis geosporum]|uniref:12008_t:CDS:1 n=1 Tax=Funneliformis geosporum TaxID=1117311 RepID=A0A9W4SNF6_9GLOM|nr:12008_t:CDS:1 [Funneliformis geosporum]